MNVLLLLLALAFFPLAGPAPALADDAPALVRFDSDKWPGTDPAFSIQVNELERTGAVSKVQVIHRKGAPTGSILISMKGFYEIAKARHAAYLTFLKEDHDAEGKSLYTVGFTDENSPDFKTAFGEPYSETKEDGSKRILMEVAMMARVYDGDNRLGHYSVPVTPSPAPTTAPSATP